MAAIATLAKTNAMTDDFKPPIAYWVFSAVLLIWALGGASIYVAYFTETPEEFARAVETAANAQAYADYIDNIPLWAIAIGIVTAATRLFGAIGLLLRRAWALQFFTVSVALFLVILIRAFVFANAASVMSGPHIATEGVFLALGLLAVWFARVSRSKNYLK